MAGEPSTSFAYPEFWFYPPYFTLQPIQETQLKQKDLWRDLILRYCKHHKIYTVSNDDTDEFPPFDNKAINRRLNRVARTTILTDLIQRGDAVWTDPKTKRSVIILWRSLAEWSETIYTWAINTGNKDSVLLIDDLISGDETRGTDIEGIHREVLIKALGVLEGKGKAKVFKGNSSDEEGVKFF